MNKTAMKYIILISTLIFLTLVWLASGLFQSRSYELPVIPEVKNITRIEIRYGEAGLTALAISNGRWYVEPDHLPADEDGVKAMIDAARNFSLSDLISRGGNLEAYELDPAKRFDVKIFDGSVPALHFILGKVSATHKHTYAMLAGNNSVFQAKGNIYFTFAKSNQDMRSRLIFSFVQDQIERITIVENGKQYSITKTGTTGNAVDFTWEASWKKGPAAKDKVNDFLKLASPMYTLDFPDDKTIVPGTLQRTLIFKTPGTENEIKIFGKNKEGNYYALVNNSRQFYIVSGVAAENYLMPITNF